MERLALPVEPGTNDPVASSSTTGPSTDPMRLGWSVGPGDWLKPDGIQSTIRDIQQAEAFGFETAWASEDPDGGDAFAALGVLSRETTTISLGTGMTNPYFRSANLLAASIATLQRA